MAAGFRFGVGLRLHHFCLGSQHAHVSLPQMVESPITAQIPACLRPPLLAASWPSRFKLGRIALGAQSVNVT